MLQNYEVDIQDFIKITSAGVVVADYVQVREALIRKYKEVYGSDIDLSTSSADGVYVHNLALIINNILQAFKNIYNNLDVNTASGVYLDNLCALANVTRKGETKSTASVNITNDGDSTFTTDNLILVDKSGTEWIYNKSFTLAPKGTTLPDGTTDTQSIIVECREPGPVEAPAGWIDNTIEMLPIIIEQPSDANIGQKQESDASLRARRAQSTGADGTTVLESLVASLFEISGIRDVKIYNNNTGVPYLSKDNTNVPNHGVYIILRKEEGITVDDSIIGEIIYNKLTPGISSTESTDNTTGNPKSYDYIPSKEDVQITLFQSTMYWKEAIPVNPEIEIVLNTFDNFTDDPGIIRNLL